MTTVNLKIRLEVPNWQWCECHGRGYNKKSGERCRFCQEVKRRGSASGYTCLLHDKALWVDEGGNVVKCSACSLWKDWDVDYTQTMPEPEDNKSMKWVIQQTLKRFKKLYQGFRNEGYPEYLALDASSKQILEEWK